ncbi:MAG TPA: alpha/beta hydrolase [Xanthobacteraceae bacterium]|jgi:pimeloyl-ACP methyl ester carboxylesterase|nr:alpha/beta hydrolase [Xanthobacteraceae bacterium]
MTAHPTPDCKENAKDSGVSRRVFIAASAAAGLALSKSAARGAIVRTDLASLPPYGNGTLPAGIRSRTVANVNGLTVHMLEAGFDEPGRPAVLLLHGFPELAYSWRKVMLPLAAAGYHVIAPDQRGYGRTLGWDDSYDADPDPFRTLNMVRDAIALVYALGYRQVAAVAGHDAGAPVAAWSALIRPDIFRSLALMSSPFAGAPSLPFNTANGAAPPRPAPTDDELDAELAKLDRPRKYYQNYQRTRGANDNMLHAPQGLHAFLRAYYHYKSADWKGNKPFPLKARTAEEMAKIPTYYVMDKDKGMAETVAAEMPSAAEIAACKWLTEAELDVYVTEYSRTGFTGALQGYRVRRGSDPKTIAELQTFSGRTIDVPSIFIAGKSDWGVYQTPGAAETMQRSACTRMVGFHLLDGAGHWVQQEQPEQVRELLIAFLRDQQGRSVKP